MLHKVVIVAAQARWVQLRESKISMGVGAQAHKSSPFYHILWATFMSLSSSVHTDLRFSQLYTNMECFLNTFLFDFA